MKTVLKFALYIAAGYGLVSLVILASVHAVTKGPFERVAAELPKLKQEARSAGMEFDLGKIIDEKPIPDSENAAQDLYAALSLTKTIMLDSDYRRSNWHDKLSRTGSTERRALLEDFHLYDPFVERLKVAVKKPHLRFKPKTFFENSSAGISSVRSAIEILQDRIEVEVAVGLTHQALDELRMAYALCTLMQDQPGLGTISSQAQNYRLADAAASRLVSAFESIEGGLDELEKLVLSSRVPLDLGWAVRFEATYKFLSIREWSKEGESWNKMIARGDGYYSSGVESVFSDRLPATLSKELITQVFEARYLQILIPAFTEFQRTRDPFSFASSVDSELNRASIIEDPTFEVLRLTYPDWSQKLDMPLSKEAGKNLLLGLIQLIRYKQQNGHLPKSLKEAHISLIDPYSRAPLHYLYLGSEAVIYSVGPNRVDDGGLPQSRDIKMSYAPFTSRKSSLSGPGYYESSY